MKKNDLIAAIAAKENCTKKEADKALNLVLDVISEALVAGEKISITGFGTFEVHERPARQCKNPRTGEVMTTKPCKALTFKAGKTLKESLNPNE
ncbi:MAG: HU family DNA-binding protein [Oscillospiraceae bacterium]|nr:HU family DNA-binding protein [Oscillospiraceae bacterium]